VTTSRASGKAIVLPRNTACNLRSDDSIRPLRFCVRTPITHNLNIEGTPSPFFVRMYPDARCTLGVRQRAAH
jgi:hypothetical protein